MLARLCYAALRTFGIPTLARRWQDGGVILCYHNVVAADARCGDLSLHMPVEAFARQMRWLAAHCEVVSLPQFLGRLESGGLLRGVATVTFDDGYAGVFTHAWPLLVELGIPATTFIVADAPGRSRSFWWDHSAVQQHADPARHEQWLTKLHGDGQAILGSLSLPPTADPLPDSYAPAAWQEIARVAAAGMGLGAHSATHRSLPTLSDAQLARELVASRETIARETGVHPECFAYPYGRWDARVRDAARAAGYRAAVALDYGLNHGDADPWALRRVNIPAGISDAAFAAWASGIRLRRQHS